MVRQSHIEGVIPFKRVAKVQSPAEKPTTSPRRSARLNRKPDAVQSPTKARKRVQTPRVGMADLSDEIVEQILLDCVETFPFSYASADWSDAQYKDAPWAYSGIEEKTSLAPWFAVRSHRLSQLCLVNKRFKRIADSILYRYVTIQVSAISSWAHNPGASALLRLLSQPDLTRHVESLHFLYSKTVKPGGANEHINHTQTKLNSVFGINTKTVPALAELISACPNLHNLRIEIGNMDLASARDVGAAIAGLAHLKRLHIHINNRAEEAVGAIIAQLVPRTRKLASLFLAYQRLTKCIGDSGRDIQPHDILSNVWTDRLVLVPLIKPSFIDELEVKFMLSGLAVVPKSLEVQGHYYSDGLGAYLEEKGGQISRLSMDNYDNARQPPVWPASIASCRNLITLHMASSPLMGMVMASLPHAQLQKLSLTWWNRHVNIFEPLHSWLSTNSPAQLLEIKIRVELTGLRIGSIGTDLRTLKGALQDAKSCDAWCDQNAVLQKPACFAAAVQEEMDRILEIHPHLSGQRLDELIEAPLGASFEPGEAPEEALEGTPEAEDNESDNEEVVFLTMSDVMSEDALLLSEEQIID